MRFINSINTFFSVPFVSHKKIIFPNLLCGTKRGCHEASRNFNLIVGTYKRVLNTYLLLVSLSNEIKLNTPLTITSMSKLILTFLITDYYCMPKAFHDGVPI